MKEKHHAEAQRRRERRLGVAANNLPLRASAPLREIFIVILVFATPQICNAQTLLRWQLKAGDAFTVEIEQHTDSIVAFSAKSATTKIGLTLKLAWKVTAATDNGFTIRQTVEQVHEKLVTQDMGTIEYDSATAARPTGQARELAESIKPLIGAEFELMMKPNGEITSVTPANDVAKTLLAATDKTNPNAASHEGLQQMLRRPLAVLPEKKVKPGDTWSVASQRVTAAGPLNLETTYELQSIDEKGLAKIAMTAKAQPGTGSKMTIKEHQHSGTIQFSATDGRLLDIDQTQKLVTERPYRETTITVTLTSEQKTSIKSQ